jgi:hypothetical protein
LRARFFFGVWSGGAPGRVNVGHVPLLFTWLGIGAGGDFLGEGRMGVEGLGDLAGEPEVVVGGEVGVVDEFEGVMDGRGGGRFDDGGGFIEFVKHGDVEAGGAMVEAGAGLGPEGLAIEAGDGVEGFVLITHGGEVAPAEAGKDDGEKCLLVLPHPCGVTEDGARVGGAEDLGGGAVGVFQGGVMAFFGVEFGDVGPEVDVGAAGLVEAVVGPVAFGAVVGGVEPALITAEEAVEEFGFFGGRVCLSGEGGGEEERGEERGGGVHARWLGW